ncbi:PAS domain-containing protein [uncultured Psychroserpens sp.]|uniref:PAS domain-containing protein n=1 Tax=uncultured Psychroserpens sp. TaxID=255436 RepID=UPI00261C4631|nr:PAS domain-containing protein [uncultured Psychroserpens sp.]
MKNNLSNMMALDIYLSSLSKEDFETVSSKIDYDSSKRLPLMSWDIYSDSLMLKRKKAQREHDILKVRSLAKKLNWQNDINAIFNEQQFEAILITDIDQKIIWVNQGFTAMTGYSKVDALNKTPHFLQGPETSNDSKERIRAKLNAITPFTEVIINYRKDKTPYKCEVKIFPIGNDEATHFIALERQVS